MATYSEVRQTDARPIREIGTDIFFGVALVAIFTMVPFAVIGALQALDLSAGDAARPYDTLPQPSP